MGKIVGMGSFVTSTGPRGGKKYVNSKGHMVYGVPPKTAGTPTERGPTRVEVPAYVTAGIKDPVFRRRIVPALVKHGLLGHAEAAYEMGAREAHQHLADIVQRVAVRRRDYKGLGPEAGHEMMYNHSAEFARLRTNLFAHHEEKLAAVAEQKRQAAIAAAPLHRGVRILTTDPEDVAAIKRNVDRFGNVFSGANGVQVAPAKSIDGHTGAIGLYSIKPFVDHGKPPVVTYTSGVGAHGGEYTVGARYAESSPHTRADFVLTHELGHALHGAALIAATRADRENTSHATRAGDAWNNSAEWGTHSFLERHPAGAVLEKLSERWRAALPGKHPAWPTDAAGNRIERGPDGRYAPGVDMEALHAVERRKAEEHIARSFPSPYASTLFAEHVAEHVAMYHLVPDEHRAKFPEDHALIRQLHQVMEADHE